MHRIVRTAALPLTVLCWASLLAAAPAPAAVPAPAGAAQAPAAAALKAGCSGLATAPIGSDWQHGKANTSTAGHPGYMQGYDLVLQSKGVALAEVKGFNEQNQLVWFSVPAMDPDSPHRKISVAWGNNLATPEIRVKPAFGQMGATVTFNC
ncbi:hypothetical protein [Streptomyces sp. NPDC054863]